MPKPTSVCSSDKTECQNRSSCVAPTKRNDKTGLRAQPSTSVRKEFASDGATKGGWCGRKDLNLHELPHQNLNLARLPIPPRPHSGRFASMVPTNMALPRRRRERSPFRASNPRMARRSMTDRSQSKGSASGIDPIGLREPFTKGSGLPGSRCHGHRYATAYDTIMRHAYAACEGLHMLPAKACICCLRRHAYAACEAERRPSHASFRVRDGRWIGRASQAHEQVIERTIRTSRSIDAMRLRKGRGHGG